MSPIPLGPSNAALGRAFELASLRWLSSPPLRLSLLHIGQSNDRGIDLRGWWPIPDSTPPSPAPTTPDSPTRRKRWSVLVQCKAERRRLGAWAVRELEGVIGIESGVQGRNKVERETRRRITIGVLVSQSGFSDEAFKRAAASELPISLVHLNLIESQLETTTGEEKHECRAFVVNTPLRELLGPALGVEIRRSLDGSGTSVNIVDY
ncbi:hypothetical protein RQP46_001406 [Phenoliferia psychrophenolica]